MAENKKQALNQLFYGFLKKFGSEAKIQQEAYKGIKDLRQKNTISTSDINNIECKLKKISSPRVPSLSLSKQKTFSIPHTTRDIRSGDNFLPSIKSKNLSPEMMQLEEIQPFDSGKNKREQLQKDKILGNLIQRSPEKPQNSTKWQQNQLWSLKQIINPNKQHSLTKSMLNKIDVKELPSNSNFQGDYWSLITQIQDQQWHNLQNEQRESQRIVYAKYKKDLVDQINQSKQANWQNKQDQKETEKYLAFLDSQNKMNMLNQSKIKAIQEKQIHRQEMMRVQQELEQKRLQQLAAKQKESDELDKVIEQEQMQKCEEEEQRRINKQVIQDFYMNQVKEGSATKQIQKQIDLETAIRQNKETEQMLEMQERQRQIQLEKIHQRAFLKNVGEDGLENQMSKNWDIEKRQRQRKMKLLQKQFLDSQVKQKKIHKSQSKINEVELKLNQGYLKHLL